MAGMTQDQPQTQQNGRLRASLTRRLLDTLYLSAGYLAGFFLVLIFVLMMALSLGRQFGLNIPSGDDFTAWSMVGMSFLGLAHTFRKGEIIRVGLLLERLNGRAKQVFELFSLTIGAVFVGYFTWQAVILSRDSLRFNDMSQGAVAIPLWIPQSAMTLGLALFLIAIFDEMINVLRGNRPSYEREPAKTPEELVERVASGGGV